MLSRLNALTGIAGAALVAIVLIPGPASAETAKAMAGGEPFKVAFAYSADDPAEKIYSHLQSVARSACTDHGSRSLRLAQAEKTCARGLLDQAVAGIGRADLAQLHQASVAAFAANDAAGAAPTGRTDGTQSVAMAQR